MPTPDIHPPVHMPEAQVEDRESARLLTMKEKIDFQRLLMEEYASGVDPAKISVAKRDAAMSLQDKIFSHWISRYGKQYSGLVANDAAVRRKIIETLSGENQEGVRFIQQLLDVNLQMT